MNDFNKEDEKALVEHTKLIKHNLMHKKKNGRNKPNSMYC